MREATQLTPTTAAVVTQPELDHLVCCSAAVGDVALCGTDVSALPWVPDGPTTCAACLLIDEMDDGWCPRYRMACADVSVVGA